MPGLAGPRPARFALGLSADFRTTPGLIFFYPLSLILLIFIANARQSLPGRSLIATKRA